MLHGRERECAQLDGLLDAARAGRSGALVLRGEAGIGKSALLDYAGERADGFRILRGAGIESESEFPFAAVHQVLRPVLGHVDALPQRQRLALDAAFGLGCRRRRRSVSRFSRDTDPALRGRRSGSRCCA